MKFGRNVQVNTHRLTESHFRFGVTHSHGRDVISRRKVLPPFE